MAASAYVEIRLDQLALEWIEAVAELVTAVHDADRALLEDAVAEAAGRVDEVMFNNALRRSR